MLKFLFTVVTVSPTAAIETATIITITSTQPAAISSAVTSLLPAVTSYTGKLYNANHILKFSLYAIYMVHGMD